MVHYTYNPNGQRIKRTITYSHSPTGAVTSIQINDQQPVKIQRNAIGQITC